MHQVFYNDPVRGHLAILLLHITFPYLLLIALTAFSSAVLNTWHRFAIPAFTPVLLNVALILVAWCWVPYSSHPAQVLACGVLLGGVAQLLIQLPGLKQIGCLCRPRWRWRDPGVQRILKLMIPVLFGVSVAQIGMLIDTAFASFLPVGSISWLYYSDRLTYLPLGVIGVALATVVLPSLSRQHHEGSERYAQTLDWALRWVALCGLPTAIGLLMCADPILMTLLQRGSFHVRDVVMSGESLRAFALGLPAFMAIKVLASAFYARQEISVPVKVAAYALLINVIFNVLLIGPLHHAGLALATSLAAWFNASGLLWVLYRRDICQWSRHGARILSTVVVSNMVMAAALFSVSASMRFWEQCSEGQRVLYLLGTIGLAVVVYSMTLWILGVTSYGF